MQVDDKKIVNVPHEQTHIFSTKSYQIKSSNVQKEQYIITKWNLSQKFKVG